jgi:hypothetical protein
MPKIDLTDAERAALADKLEQTNGKSPPEQKI